MNQKYSDVSAAVTKNGSEFKRKLTKSPFVRGLEYGNNHDGYWTYESMVLQLEDCIDVLSHTHPQFEYLFLFDHSNGHDRLQPQGLSISKISIKHGGKQPIMRDSLLTYNEFGPFHSSSSLLQPGMCQSMQFKATYSGPCYLNDEEKIARKLDVRLGKTREKDMIKHILIENLKAAGILNPTGTKKQLQEQSIRFGLPIKATKEVITEGQIGRQKGALQILFEKGWIDPDHIWEYTTEGKKESVSSIQTEEISEQPIDPTGCNFSIKALLLLQWDFISELTLLQFHGRNIGAIVDRSPKCHPEIAGEGIEYAQALSKFLYRRSPISEKQTKSKFLKLVAASTNHLTVLSIQRIRSCSKKARSYMKMYKTLGSVAVDDNLLNDKHSIMEGAIKIYCKLKREGKTHRSVSDRNVGDVNDIERSIPLDINTNTNSDNDKAVSNKNGHLKKELIKLLLDKMTCM